MFSCLLKISNISKNKKFPTSRFYTIVCFIPYKVAVAYLCRGKKALHFVGKVLVGLWLYSFMACSQAEVRFQFDMPAQKLVQSLDSLSNQTETLVLFPYDLVENRQARAIKGHYTILDAVGMLLRDTDLVGGFSEKGVLVISALDTNASHNQREETMSTKKNILATVINILMGSGVQGVIAQEARTDLNDNEWSLEEIIVTAEKRSQNLQNTAMAISALGKDTIDKRNLVGMGDYLNSLPGITVLDQGPGYNSVVIRGLAVSPQTEGFQSSPISGVYFGETAISGFGILGNSSDIKLVDMERVEVLRGPQGTLYGAGAMGGVVRNIPSAPNFERMEGKLQAGYSNTGGEGGNNSVVKGVLNIPVIEDTLAIRAVAYRFDNSGYYKNIVASNPTAATSGAVTDYSAVRLDRNNRGQNEVTGGRISLLWQPIDQLSLNLSYLDQDIDQDGRPQADFDLPGGFSQSRFALRTSPSGLPDQRESLVDNVEITNLTVNYDIGWADITSSSSWADQLSEINFDGSAFLGDSAALSSIADYTADFFSQEIRLASQFAGPWQVLFGMYYEEIDRNLINNTIFSGSDLSLSDGLLGVGPDVTLIFGNVNPRELNQQALFSEVSYDIVDNLTLTLGARVFDYDRKIILGDLPDTGAPVNGPIPIVVDSSEDDTSFKVSLEYTPSDYALMYATWSEGFRLGYPIAAASPGRIAICDQDNDGIYDASNGVSTDARIIDSDFVENFELGGKFALLDNRLTVNAALYQIDWDGIPVSVVFEGENRCAEILNGGEARSRGVELELAYRWTENVLLNFNSSYVNAELTKVAAGVNASKGDRLPGSADVNASLGIEYQFTVAGYEAYLRSDYTYVGGFYNNLQEAGTEAGDYSRVNVKTGIAIDNITVDLFIDNLTDDDGITWVDAQLLDNRGNRLQPRTVGLNVGYQF